MLKNWKSAVLAVGLLGLFAAAAAAAPAVVDRNANFRAGPGTNHRVLTVLRAGTVIEVVGCRGGWCEAFAGPNRGFIAQSLLARTGVVRRYVIVRPPLYGLPPVYPDVYGFYGPRYGPYPWSYYPYPPYGSGFSIWFGF